jgi:hypothetical protein
MSISGELSARINGTLNDAEKNKDAASYQRLATIFSEYEIQLREHIQEITKEEISRIIQKLESQKEINPEELKFVKLWIVGDAEYYTRMENNFNDWLIEVKRIVDEINKINAAEPDFEAASRLRAMLEDGKRVIYDISFFLEKKEREAKFTEATLELDKEEKELLVKLLRSKLASKEF